MKKLCILNLIPFASFIAVAGCVDGEPYVPVGPHFSVEYIIEADGTINQTIKVDLFTGDLSQYGEIKDGGMTVNGEAMKLGKEAHDLPYYYVESPTIAANTKYLFAIGLADGRQATASVITQKTMLATLTAPATADPKHDMDISWTGTSNHDYLVVSVSYTFKNEDILIYTRKLDPSEVTAGAITLERAAFVRSGANTVRIQLVSWKMGDATNFVNGGRIVSKMAVSRNVTVD